MLQVIEELAARSNCETLLAVLVERIPALDILVDLHEAVGVVVQELVEALRCPDQRPVLDDVTVLNDWVDVRFDEQTEVLAERCLGVATLLTQPSQAETKKEVEKRRSAQATLERGDTVSASGRLERKFYRGTRYRLTTERAMPIGIVNSIQHLIVADLRELLARAK